ncbi:MAG TPA: site-specific integrase, partial [Actinokineospora sp.]|nr:site-specific integrase [Actinokineospora sp.]
MPPASSRPRRVDLLGIRAALPVPVRTVLDDYERHLALERGLSPHTVRAYLGDAVSLLGHALGVQTPDSTAGGTADPAARLSAADEGAVPAEDAGRDGAGQDRAGLGLNVLDLAVLRGWLAAQLGAGASRTTMARRAAAVRTFTAWAYRREHLAVDPGARLV